jgi:hypothetical protein
VAVGGRCRSDHALKLVFVVVLSGLHGLQSGRVAPPGGRHGPAPLSGNAAPIVVVLALVVAMLAVVNPFWGTQDRLHGGPTPSIVSA